MEQFRKAIGTFFHANRQACGKSLEQAGHETGFTPSAIEQLEDGKTDWGLQSLATLASFYNVQNQFLQFLFEEGAALNKRKMKQ